MEEEKNNSLKKCMSESDTKLFKNKMTLPAKPNPNQGSYKFDLIIDNLYQNLYFQDENCRKLYFELEVSLKGSFTRNWENLAKNVSFNSMDYDFFLNLKNNLNVKNQVSDINILQRVRKEVNQSIDIETSESENSIANKEKFQYIEKHLSDNYPVGSKKNKGNLQLPAVELLLMLFLNI